MLEWNISEQDIQIVEKLLLPQGSHFPEDARKVIQCWHSVDVSACPSSGKTTVLLAKLKLLADRMPLENGAGICVLSHTNVAVDEIKKRLSDYADRLLAYPNYIGTIQSFVDRFITFPYLRNISGKNVQVVDSDTYSQYMMNILRNERYGTLNYFIECNLKSNKKYKTKKDYLQALYIRDDGALCVKSQKKALAVADKNSTKQYKELRDELLKREGLIQYQDAYIYVKDAVHDMQKTFVNLFSSRFRYIFIDEYQDCDDIQRQAIDLIFDSTKCAMFKMGDSDQAIYNSFDNKTGDWIPQEGFLSIMTSCRFNQEIANIICKLKTDDKSIVTLIGETGVKPVLIIFSPENIDKVIGKFISALEAHSLYDNNGIYKAIGAIKKENSSGLRIGSYWESFDALAKKKTNYNYWVLVDDIIQSLLDGKLYKVEKNIRVILCRIFYYIGVKHSVSRKIYNITSIKKLLDEKYREQYRQWIYEMSRMNKTDRQSVDQMLRKNINELLQLLNLNIKDVFQHIPNYFLDETIVGKPVDIAEKNVFIDPIRGRRIIFDTIHGVKGETHDATLYLETERYGVSDLNRILSYFGVDTQGTSPFYDSSRKLAYVGMSRPRKLLCVAMQAKTYEKSQGVFDKDWEIIDLRQEKEYNN